LAKAFAKNGGTANPVAIVIKLQPEQGGVFSAKMRDTGRI
jgi:hypothetical protein